MGLWLDVKIEPQSAMLADSARWGFVEKASGGGVFPTQIQARIDTGVDTLSLAFKRSIPLSVTVAGESDSSQRMMIRSEVMAICAWPGVPAKGISGQSVARAGRRKDALRNPIDKPPDNPPPGCRVGSGRNARETLHERASLGPVS